MGSLWFPAVILGLLYTMVVQITEEAIQMGMFSEAADYSFQNCRKEMLQMVTKSGGLLQTELNNNPDFKIMWKGNVACSKTIPWGTPEHMAAVQSYAETSMGNALQLIGKNNCLTVYSGTGNEYNTKIREKGNFESFFPTNLHYIDAIEASLSDNNGTVFNITSCSVIRFEDYGCISEEIDLLTSPTEVFTVMESKESSSSFLSSSLLNLMASLLMLYTTN
uniref:NAD(P)(+)--arginine ADP-ribosyltransferase n=1 Tax=Cyprinus carpio carpio TaxID=630221 RepID=A0A9J7XRR6_CYPCA